MRRFLQRSALTFLDRSGLTENYQGGRTGWTPATAGYRGKPTEVEARRTYLVEPAAVDWLRYGAANAQWPRKFQP